DLQLARDDFDVACGQFRVFRPRHPCRDTPGDLDDIFTAQRMRLFRKLGIFFRSKYDLCKSLAIAQVDENYAAVIASDVYPSGERGLLADIGFPKRIAMVRAKHVSYHFERSRGIRGGSALVAPRDPSTPKPFGAQDDTVDGARKYASN